MNKKILFVSQDQGSGNALFLVINKLSEEKNLNVIVFARKQSKEIFRDQGITFIDLDDRDFNKKIDFLPDLIVTGASMRNCIEKEAILFGRNNQIKTITILDFWSNYWQRFTTNVKKDTSFLPDYIFVMDNIAKKHMISEGFPENRLIITGNPYFDTFMIPDNIEESFNMGSILVISQPIYQNRYYQSDYSLLEDLLDIISRIDKKIKIILRPHPKETFDSYIKYAKCNIIIDTEKDIKELIKECGIIIGKHSTVLFEAVFRGKLVISYQPVEEKPDRLVTNQLGLSYLVRSKSELECILGKALNNQLKSREIGVLKYYHDGKNTERVIKKIKDILY